MRTSPRLWAAVALALCSPAALADPHGLLTLVVGVPLLLVASVVLGILLVLRPSAPLRVVSIALFAPTLAYSLYVALDALTLLKDLGSENSMIGFAFFGLLALACRLFFLIVRRRPVAGG
jgi:FtsH-binding integral membrane protein